MTTDRLTSCRGCSEVPAVTHRIAAESKTWVVECERCLRRVSSVESVGHALAAWAELQANIAPWKPSRLKWQYAPPRKKQPGGGSK